MFHLNHLIYQAVSSIWKTSVLSWTMALKYHFSKFPSKRLFYLRSSGTTRQWNRFGRHNHLASNPRWIVYLLLQIDLANSNVRQLYHLVSNFSEIFRFNPIFLSAYTRVLKVLHSGKYGGLMVHSAASLIVHVCQLFLPPLLIFPWSKTFCFWSPSVQLATTYAARGN